MTILTQEEIRTTYEQRILVLKPVKDRIDAILHEILQDVPRIDQISSRVKDVDKFVQKAMKTDNNGERKYKYPLVDIHDQIGCRVVVHYKSDVEPVTNCITKEFSVIENLPVNEPDPSSFAYRARHIVCSIPSDIVADLNPPINFFEVQISTLFEHAWAEANHDLGYKSESELPVDDRRLLAFTSAQAWGADRIFDDLWQARRGTTPAVGGD